MSGTLEIKFIHWRKLCRMFNDGDYWARVQSGEFSERMLRNGHPSAPKAPVPFCTRSQTIPYLDAAGRRVAVVHQYLRPDGTLGCSGKPEPKSLRVDDTVYRTKK